MCDGQYKKMQDFLRKQSDDPAANVDMVGEIATFLYEITKKHVIYEQTLELIKQLLLVLVELCTGNYSNRVVAFNMNIISVINYLLQIDIIQIKCDGHEFDLNEKEIKFLLNQAFEIKASAVQLLESLLEEISPDTPLMSKQIAEGLNFEALRWSMVDFYLLKSDKYLIAMENDDDARRALFNCYKIMMHLVDCRLFKLDELSKYYS